MMYTPLSVLSLSRVFSIFIGRIIRDPIPIMAIVVGRGGARGAGRLEVLVFILSLAISGSLASGHKKTCVSTTPQYTREG